MIRRFSFFFMLLLIILFIKPPTAGQAVVSANIFQETAYPVDTPEPTYEPSPYGGPSTEMPTPYGGPSSPTNTPLPTNQSATRTTPLTPSPSPRPGSTGLPTRFLTGTPSETAGPSLTPERDLFGTEDAELANSRVTPPPSETPAPTSSITPTLSPTAAPGQPSGFQFNPIWFFGGFGIPLAALLGGWLLKRIKRSGEFG